MPSPTLLTPINKRLVSVESVNTKQDNLMVYGPKFMHQILHSAFVQGIVRVVYSPSLLIV